MIDIVVISGEWTGCDPSYLPRAVTPTCAWAGRRRPCGLYLFRSSSSPCCRSLVKVRHRALSNALVDFPGFLRGAVSGCVRGALVWAVALLVVSLFRGRPLLVSSVSRRWVAIIGAVCVATIVGRSASDVFSLLADVDGPPLFPPTLLAATARYSRPSRRGHAAVPASGAGSSRRNSLPPCSWVCPSPPARSFRCCSASSPGRRSTSCSDRRAASRPSAAYGRRSATWASTSPTCTRSRWAGKARRCSPEPMPPAPCSSRCTDGTPGKEN